MNKQDLKSIIEEAYYELLEEGLVSEAEEDGEETEETPDGEFPDAEEVEAVAEEPNPTEDILAKFPTLKKTIVHLMTPEYKNFVEKVGWMSPKPSTFRVEFKSGQDMLLKWMGKGFQANVEGKRYMLDNLAEYQQCLDKIGTMLAAGPITSQFDEEPASGEDVFGGVDGGGGDFPGEEGGAAPETGAEETPAADTPAGEEDVFAGIS